MPRVGDAAGRRPLREDASPCGMPMAAAKGGTATPAMADALPPLALGAFLAGAAAMRRKSGGRQGARPTARRVTREQIMNLSLDDIPEGFRFRPKISLGMARRDEVKQAIEKELEDTYFIMAFNKDGMPTPDLEAARAMFPPKTKVRVLKNSFVRKAMERTPWAELATVLRGANMYVFVKEDTDLKPTIQAWLKITKQFARADKCAAIYEAVGKREEYANYMHKPLCGGMIRDEWNVILPEDIPKLKDFPTKTELIAKIAGSIKQVPQKLAVCAKQLPQKIAIGTKKIVEKMEEEGKGTVAEVAV